MPPTFPKSPTVAVVLCTHNGAEWVEEQLQSLLAQTHNVAIRVFDDASNDNTVEKVRALASNADLDVDITCIERTKALGVVSNFSDGIQSALNEGFEYIALADQDDIWLPTRIERGMATLQMAESATDAAAAHLVHSDLTMVNASNELVHRSFMEWRGYETGEGKSLASILGQNGVMGNTILMNAALARLALPFPNGLHVHDYWLAVVAELLGDRHYLSDPLVRYRIHDKNVSNPSHSVSFSSKSWIKNWSIQKFLSRNFRLPFKEDTRDLAIQSLIADERFANISSADKALIHAFQRYLDFDSPRLELAKNTFKHGFFRPSFRHRLRVIASILTTQRYKNL